MGVLSIVLRFVLLLAVLAGLLFGSAGSLAIPAFHGYLLLFAASCVIQYHSAGPDLMKERLKPAPGGTDSFTQKVSMMLLVAHLVTAGLDVGRFHWSDSVPGWLQCAALFGMAGCLGIWSLATRENRFFSTVIRIQRERGHHVISTGPYRLVRHPGYAAAIGAFPLSYCSGLVVVHCAVAADQRAVYSADPSGGPDANRGAAGLPQVCRHGPLPPGPSGLVSANCQHGVQTAKRE